LTSLDNKAALRRYYRAKRSQFVERLDVKETQLAFSVLPSPLAAFCEPGKLVAGYVAVGSEADPARLMAMAADRGCALALPHVTSRLAPMRFLRWAIGEPLEAGPFGLMQPISDSAAVEPDIVIVPLVAFDDRLMRLGQGAGHYDRALSLLDKTTAIGLAWSVQQAEMLPADPWDVPLDAILTEKSWISR
jgi:5-formyltetrahydrofolate cyclo-ligase